MGGGGERERKRERGREREREREGEVGGKREREGRGRGRGGRGGGREGDMTFAIHKPALALDNKLIPHCLCEKKKPTHKTTIGQQ